jgi:hypothetical protein
MSQGWFKYLQRYSKFLSLLKSEEGLNRAAGGILEFEKSSMGLLCLAALLYEKILCCKVFAVNGKHYRKNIEYFRKVYVCNRQVLVCDSSSTVCYVR